MHRQTYLFSQLNEGLLVGSLYLLRGSGRMQRKARCTENPANELPIMIQFLSKKVKF